MDIARDHDHLDAGGAAFGDRRGRKAEAVLKALDPNASEAITLFYRQVALRRGLPFEIKLPNETTRAAMRDAIEGKHLTEWSDLEELKVTHG